MGRLTFNSLHVLRSCSFETRVGMIWCNSYGRGKTTVAIFEAYAICAKFFITRLS